jgi:hypothetical protein
MVELNIDPATPLKNLMQAMDASINIYVNGALPSVALPDEYIVIEKNGGIGTNASKRGNATCTLLVSLYVRLQSGATNVVRESYLLGLFQSVFNSPLISGRFSYHLAPYPFVYDNKNIDSGYSTKIINVQTFINY